MADRIRLDAVELKVTMSPGQARRVGIWDAAAGNGVMRKLWFCEQAGASSAALPLLDAGVILRLRETGDRSADTTARVRPCRRSLLSGYLHASGHEAESAHVDVEADWSADRRVMAVSMTESHPPGSVRRVLSTGGPPDSLFTAAQRRFLTACADRATPFGSLTAFGPVHARWWPELMWSRMPLSVERWVATASSGARLDVVELSRRVDRQGAEIAQLALESGLHRCGVDPADCDQIPKTRRFLELFTAQP
ncbi:hypothetical protein [Streptomyces sp. IB201691-2A2]|uniref:hypothetical protein n=1 Tax=Streptomyces sp. IB201691-2A2 TaxID=2561920 RepID=UPI00117CE9A1|nr:hypothetical protein [Streptomyces sp. IB201691-2A2]TRO58539.1 hypothetical protein E4K73_38425 [Streptomyces sp. IB201691-2A2]